MVGVQFAGLAAVRACLVNQPQVVPDRPAEGGQPLPQTAPSQCYRARAISTALTNCSTACSRFAFAQQRFCAQEVAVGQRIREWTTPVSYSPPAWRLHWLARRSPLASGKPAVMFTESPTVGQIAANTSAGKQGIHVPMIWLPYRRALS